MEELKKTVAQNIKLLRTQNQLTQFELGEKLNYSDKAISKWERGESIPDAYILKQIGEIFNVSVDYILTDHDGEAPPKPVKPKNNNHLTITKISIISIWTLAILIFVVFWIFDYIEWIVFVFALPVSLITLLVFNSIWGKRKNNFYIISALVWSIIAAIYFSLLPYNLWMLFILGIPAEIITYLCFKIKKAPKA